MKHEIVQFCQEICKEYGLRADYLTGKDLYRITKNGKMVMAFYTKSYYDMPPRMRKNHIKPMIKLGLTHNLGESYYEQSYMRTHGKRIS